MSVLVEGITLVVKRTVVDQKYTGGLPQYASNCPNGSFCADEHLARVGFISPKTVEDYVGALEAKGLVSVKDGRVIDVAVVDQLDGLVATCDWLRLARRKLTLPILVDAKQPEAYSMCWLEGTHPADLAVPSGWKGPWVLPGITAYQPIRYDPSTEEIELAGGPHGPQHRRQILFVHGYEIVKRVSGYAPYTHVIRQERLRSAWYALVKMIYEPASLAHDRGALQGKPFAELIEHEIRSKGATKAAFSRALLERLVRLGDAAGVVADAGEYWKQFAFNREFWRQDGAGVLDVIADDLRQRLQAAQANYDEATVGVAFGFIVLSFAAMASDDRSLRKVMGIRMGLFS